MRSSSWAVREETGLAVTDVRVLGTRSGYRLRVEVYVAAEAPANAMPNVDGREVLEARFVGVPDLPDGLIPMHRGLIERVVAARQDPSGQCRR